MTCRNLARVLALLFFVNGAEAVAPVRVVVEGTASAENPGAAGRTAALEDGLTRAVEQVAFDLIRSDGGSPQDLDVLQVLGGRSTDYAVRYRVLADRGLRAETGEYALEIEAHVDVERVARGLQSAGFLTTLPGELPTRAYRMIVETRDWAAYAAFTKALVKEGGALSAIPESFSEGRAVLRVESASQPEELLQRLVSARLENLQLQPMGRDQGEIRVQVAWIASEEPPLADDGGGP